MKNQPLTRALAAAAPLSLLLLASLGVAGCGGEAPAPLTYQVQGVIQQLPVPGDPSSQLQIAHEAIPNFVSAQGEVVGMGAMTMPFPVADGVSLDGLQVGDTVLFTLEVQWDRSPAFRITHLERVAAAEPAPVTEEEAPAESMDMESDAGTEEHGEHTHDS